MDGVPYKLTFESRQGYLYALVEADTIDRETALRYLREIAHKCTELSCDRVLLHRDIPVMLDDADLFFTTRDFLAMMTDWRVAFINPHLPIGEDMDYAVAIASSRGAEFKLFRTLQCAESWLLSG